MNNETINLFKDTGTYIAEGVEKGLPMAMDLMREYCMVLGIKSVVYIVLCFILAIIFAILMMKIIKKDSGDEGDVVIVIILFFAIVGCIAGIFSNVNGIMNFSTGYCVIETAKQIIN